MLTFVSVVHIIMAVILIVLVLLQDSKGGAMGMLGGGGGGNTVFGSTGAASFLVKATRWVAIIFAATSISLAYMTTQKTDSVLDKLTPVQGMAPGTQQESFDKVETPATNEETPAKDESPEPTKGKQ